MGTYYVPWVELCSPGKEGAARGANILGPNKAWWKQGKSRPGGQETLNTDLIAIVHGPEPREAVDN